MNGHLERQLDRIERKLDQLLTAAFITIRQGVIMSAELDTLTAQVTETNTVEDSAIVLIKGLADQIAALKTDPAALQALADSLHAKSDELAAAVAAIPPTP